MRADGVVRTENASGLGPGTTMKDICYASCTCYEVDQWRSKVTSVVWLQSLVIGF